MVVTELLKSQIFWRFRDEVDVYVFSMGTVRVQAHVSCDRKVLQSDCVPWPWVPIPSQ